MEMKEFKNVFYNFNFWNNCYCFSFNVINFKNKKVKLLQCLNLPSGLLAMYCTIYDYNYLVSVQDWSALLDTSAFISKIAFVIMCIVIVFNFIVYMKSK